MWFVQKYINFIMTSDFLSNSFSQKNLPFLNLNVAYSIIKLDNNKLRIIHNLLLKLLQYSEKNKYFM